MDDTEPSLATVHSLDEAEMRRRVADDARAAVGTGSTGAEERQATYADRLFPNTPEWAGADSIDLLRRVWAVVREAGWELVNADCVLVGQEPKIAPYRDEMGRRLAAALGAQEGRVTVRATTTDHLGFAGRGEGLAAQAVALLRQSSA